MRTNRTHATVVAASTLCFLVASVPAPAAPPANGNSQQQQRAQQQLQLQQQQLYQQQQQIQQQQQQQQLLDQQQQQQRQQQQQMQQQNAADAAQLNSLNADAAKARAELKKAQIALQAAAHKFESTIDGKPEVQAALKEFKQAQDNLQSATAGATQSLKTNPDYLKAQNEARDARAKVEALRGDQSATPQERFTAASASLQANKAVSAFESSALNKEPRVAEARTKLTAANDALRKAREAYSGILHDDPAWQAANAEVEQKQKDVAAADAKLADARKSVADRIASRTAGAQNRTGNTAITPATRPAQ